MAIDWLFIEKEPTPKQVVCKENRRIKMVDI